MALHCRRRPLPPPPPPQYHAPFHPPPPPMWAPPGPHPYDLPDMEGPHKRMRVGEAPPFDPYAPHPPMLGRASVEGERLLGLIREHGHGRPHLPPTQWGGEPYPPDGFDYGGGRGYPPQNLNNPYAQGDVAGDDPAIGSTDEIKHLYSSQNVAMWLPASLARSARA